MTAQSADLGQRLARIDAYIEARFAGEDEALRAARAAMAAAGLPAINVSPNEGKLLHLLARLAGARRILEIGTLGGYSAIWLARALPADGRLITLELDERHAAVARQNLDRAGVGDRVEVRLVEAQPYAGSLLFSLEGHGRSGRAEVRRRRTRGRDPIAAESGRARPERGSRRRKVR